MLNYLPKYYSQLAIAAFVIAMAFCSIAFSNYLLPWQWVLSASIELILFFVLLRSLSRQWATLSSQRFVRNIFTWSLIIRIIWVVFSYFFYEYQTGKPFEFLAADSLAYHEWGITIANLGIANLHIALPSLGYTDLGFPVYLGMVYTIFGDYVIIPRIINAVISAWTIILLYRLANRNFGKNTARLTAIIAMLMPNLIYYCGLHLKETLMIFLIVAFMERADQMIRGKTTFAGVLLVIVMMSSLFFFRSVLFASALFAFFSMLVFIRRPGSDVLQRFILASWVIIIFWLTFSSRIQSEFNYLLETSSDAQANNMEWRSQREEGNRLARYGSSIIFAPVMFVAPFPTYVHIEIQQNQMLMSGAYMIKNILAFFIALSLISFIRKRLIRKNIFIISFLIAYLAILAQSPFAISERFHLPALPFLIILAAFGITQLNKKKKKYYLPYLLLLVVAIIVWNWFKLAGRGLI